MGDRRTDDTILIGMIATSLVNSVTTEGLGRLRRERIVCLSRVRLSNPVKEGLLKEAADQLLAEPHAEDVGEVDVVDAKLDAPRKQPHGLAFGCRTVHT